MDEPSGDLSTMIGAARVAGSGLMRRFRRPSELRVREKGPADYVSNADLESEQTLKSILLGAHPARGFMAEEGAPEQAGTTLDRERYIVDPLDGTTNFLHGVPHFAVSIALEKEGRIVAGVVFDPAKDEMFAAELGRGAWAGSEALGVSLDADLSNALVATGIPHSNARHRHERYLGMLGAMMGEAAGIRRLGAAALDLAYVAAGRFGLFFEFGLSRWDIAAGALLVEEAGGRVTDPAGGDGFLSAGNVLATNGRMHPRALALLGEAKRRNRS
jgi:myo-inositol-1(or 4)-monophosphatase